MTTEADIKAMLHGESDECAKKVMAFRDELTVQYDSRIVHACFVAVASRIATGLRAAKIYDTGMLVRLHSEALIDELTAKVDDVKVIYTVDGQPVGSKQ